MKHMVRREIGEPRQSAINRLLECLEDSIAKINRYPGYSQVWVQFIDIMVLSQNIKIMPQKGVDKLS
jgi:hypothetical protein